MKPQPWSRKRYVIIAGALLAVAVLIGMAWRFQLPVAMFERHVFKSGEGIKNLQYGEASCMHCPFYFRFDAAPDVIQKIVARHGLSAVEAMPPFMEQTVSLFREEWWIDNKSLATARKYWREFEPQANEGGETRIRAALVVGNTVYFVTNGYTDP